MTTHDEIENYFNSAKSIRFISAETADRSDTKNNPLAYLLFDDLEIFVVPGISKKIFQFFENWESTLFIFIENNSPVRYSIVNKRDGDTINIANLEVDQSINTFINTTQEDDIIVLLIAYQDHQFPPKELLFHQDAIEGVHPPLINGYSLVYT